MNSSLDAAVHGSDEGLRQRDRGAVAEGEQRRGKGVVAAAGVGNEEEGNGDGGVGRQRLRWQGLQGFGAARGWGKAINGKEGLRTEKKSLLTKMDAIWIS